MTDLEKEVEYLREQQRLTNEKLRSLLERQQELSQDLNSLERRSSGVKEEAGLVVAAAEARLESRFKELESRLKQEAAPILEKKLDKKGVELVTLFDEGFNAIEKRLKDNEETGGLALEQIGRLLLNLENKKIMSSSEALEIMTPRKPACFSCRRIFINPKTHKLDCMLGRKEVHDRPFLNACEKFDIMTAPRYKTKEELAAAMGDAP